MMKKLNPNIFKVTCIVASVLVCTLCVASAGEGAEQKESGAAAVEPTRTLVHNGQVLSMSFSPDGKLLATGSVNSRVRLWDLGTGEVKLELSLRTGQATTGGG
jgi:WD40 repeat protein